jgi:hypothetical protein
MTGKATPMTMVVSTENAKVLYSHPGEIRDADRFVKQVKFIRQLETMGK